MRVWIYGAGGVGLGLGSALLAAGQRVGFVGRETTLAALRAKGLQRSGLFGAVSFPPDAFDTAASADEVDAPATHVLVATKSFDTEAAARALQGTPLVDASTRFVLCQNGWGNAEIFAAHHPERAIWNARVITGFRRDEPQHVTITAHAEPVHVGSLYGEEAEAIRPLCDAIDAGGIPCEPTADIAADLWAKLLYNGILNALGAICELRYGAVAAHPEASEIMRRLAEETFAVMQAAGHRTHWSDAKAYLADFHERLLPPTAEHESSTLQDLRAGKRTEIDALNGAVVRVGEEHAVPTPVHRTLLALVHVIEDQRRAREG